MAPCSLFVTKGSETHTSCFSTAFIPFIHLRQPEIVLQNLHYVHLDICCSFHDSNFVLSCVRVHELEFLIHSRMWVAFSSGLISEVKQKVARIFGMPADISSNFYDQFF